MILEQRITAFGKLGTYINSELKNGSAEWEQMLYQAEILNPWFTKEYLTLAFQSISEMLHEEHLRSWIISYKSAFESSDKKVAVIMAGNIPAVGFHDFLCVLMTGHKLIGKLSAKDKIILPYLSKKLVEIEPEFESQIQLTEEFVKDFDAVIATGSDNSARYFESYFGKYPNIIRQNRNSVAILTGKESVEELQSIAKDVYYYFGLGCRSVNKVYFPKGYDVTKFIDQMQGFDYLGDHNKFNNNYSYNRSVFLLNQIPFLDNGFSIFKEDPSFISPISVIHYEFYNNEEEVLSQLEAFNDKIQCVVRGGEERKQYILPGKTQFPSLSDYADNVDVVAFLSSL